MRGKWEWLGRPGYRLVVYITAHQRLHLAIEMSMSDADAVQFVVQQMRSRFDLTDHEWELLAATLRTTVGLEADAE